MKFTRINETTVNCIITTDDMDEQGLTFEDLFQKKDEAMLFLHEIIERAAEEVNYSPKGSFLPMQITVLPDQSVSVTLSEDGSTALSDMLKTLTERIREFLEGVLPDELKEQFRQSIEMTEVTQDEPKSLPAPVKSSDYVFAYDSIREATQMARTLPDDRVMLSKLYKGSDGRFYLRFTIAEEDPKAFASVFMRASEYGEFISVDSRRILHMDENYECVIGENALETLRRL